jgi:hypothetical protein
MVAMKQITQSNDPACRPRIYLVRCPFCNESDLHPDDCVEFYAGHACLNCATACEVCGDWLGIVPEVMIEGRRIHRTCAEDTN